MEQRVTGPSLLCLSPELPHFHAARPPVQTPGPALLAKSDEQPPPAPGSVCAIDDHRISRAGAHCFFLESFLSL